MRTKALLFDFDGILVDTEVPVLRAWQEIYEQHGQVLSLEAWAACVGTLGGFEPLDHLEELLGRPLDDRAAVQARHGSRELELVGAEMLRAGVDGYLDRARELGLEIAIVSSSSHAWVTSHLERVGRSGGWARVHCANGDAARAKPLPCLYEETLETLGIAPGEAVAFEDSPNGIAAATAAGIFCVAVPNPVTESLDLSAAGLRLRSFEEMPLDDVLARVARAA